MWAVYCSDYECTTCCLSRKHGVREYTLVQCGDDSRGTGAAVIWAPNKSERATVDPSCIEENPGSVYKSSLIISDMAERMVCLGSKEAVQHRDVSVSSAAVA